jgi:hypothetical protein
VGWLCRKFSLKAEGPGNPDGRSNAAVAMTDDTRPPGLIQRYREELEALVAQLL